LSQKYQTQSFVLKWLKEKLFETDIKIFRIFDTLKIRFESFLPRSSFSRGMRGAQPTTGIIPKNLGLFAHAQRPGARGFHMLKASEIELKI
jgi:hypothetical protein